MDREFIFNVMEKVLSGSAVTAKEAARLVCVRNEDIFSLLDAANRIRTYFRGNNVDLCSLMNAKSGICSEDCRFCAQSAVSGSRIKRYALRGVKQILAHADKAHKSGTKRFCIITSGRQVYDKKEFDSIIKAVSLIRARYPALKIDASLGELDLDMAKRLRSAGLNRYNHNLETVKRLFPKVCTTHKFSDRLRTIKIVKECGIEACSGGIFGLGEKPADRVELAFTLKRLDVDCVPLNFLNPIPGTLFEDNAPILPLELLKTVAVFRFILPEKQIRICGGRQTGLRSLQALMFVAGADSMILGNYLTTKGTEVETDLQMIRDLGLGAVSCEL